MSVITKWIRRYLTGKDSRYVFEPAQIPSLGDIGPTHIYIHIPFCRNCCPYCPYNKVPYDETLVEPYVQALLAEMNMYGNLTGQLKVSSVYIGGGTPTLLSDRLTDILAQLKSHFELTGEICIEANPAGLDYEAVSNLKRCGVNLVSLGVQSFNDKCLQLLGRNYSSETAELTLRKLITADFSSINVDLMFCLPAQTEGQLLDDLRKTVALNASQITTYPLFTFPYSTVGRYKKLRQIKMPSLRKRRRQYYLINDFLRSQGYSRVSVWSFKKGSVPRYSSVTRDGYIGLGAGAGTLTTNGFYLNTFSVNEYINRCLSGVFPTALQMRFNKKMRDYFWLYWRLYDTTIPKNVLYRRFGVNDRKLNGTFKMLKFLEMTEEHNGSFVLNNAGAFWVHLLQNYFALSYINKIWTVAMKHPWPDAIEI